MLDAFKAAKAGGAVPKWGSVMETVKRRNVMQGELRQVRLLGEGVQEDRGHGDYKGACSWCNMMQGQVYMHADVHVQQLCCFSSGSNGAGRCANAGT